MSFTSNLRRTGFATIAGLALLGGATPALAQGKDVVVTAAPVEERAVAQVVYRDLNLTLARDQRRLTSRVGAAVRKVCRTDEADATRLLSDAIATRACNDAAWQAVRPQLATAITRAGQQLAASGDVAADKGVIMLARAN